MMWRLVWRLKARGSRISFMSASPGNWFPTYTKADDTLHFTTGDIHIREIVKYENYKRFGSNVKITYDGKEVPKADEGKK